MGYYRSREYCKNSKCEVWQELCDLKSEGEIERYKKGKKIICEKCEAYKFHQYLKDNCYQIFRND